MSADECFSIAVSHSGRYIVTGGSNQVLKLWDIRTGHQIAEGLGHSGPINTVQFASDDKQILSGGKDGVIILWNLFIWFTYQLFFRAFIRFWNKECNFLVHSSLILGLIFSSCLSLEISQSISSRSSKSFISSPLRSSVLDFYFFSSVISVCFFFYRFFFFWSSTFISIEKILNTSITDIYAIISSKLSLTIAIKSSFNFCYIVQNSLSWRMLST